jgi:hypothetical protein
MLIATSQEGIVGCLRALNLTSLQIVDPPMALIFMGFSDGLPGFNRLVSGGVVGSFWRALRATSQLRQSVGDRSAQPPNRFVGED